MGDEKVILTVNGGSSSVKYAGFLLEGMRRIFSGNLERAGGKSAASVAEEVGRIVDAKVGRGNVVAVGHRIVHGGLRVQEHQRITPELMGILREAVELDLAHLPGEIGLVEAFGAAFAGVPQVACFDTAFHRELPGVAKLLAIPRRFLDKGLRRFGFHGLSYSYLMGELARVAGAEVARGRIVLAHLGSGASMAAVREGKPVDTTMGFTALSGLVMGTRPGDLDAGLVTYLMRSEGMSAERMEEFLSKECGVLGVSGTSGDMRNLLKVRGTDSRAAEAVELFCYRARQWIGALAASMGGVDTVVFSGGIGEHAAEVREGICAGLEFLGVRVDAARNDATESIISAEGSKVVVRVIATDEEIVIAKTTCDIADVCGDNPAA